MNGKTINYGNWVPEKMLKALYGDMEEFVRELKNEGVAELHYIGGLEDKLGFPGYAKTPWMISGVGILYGKK